MQENIYRLQQRVLDRLPVLKKLLREHGNMPLLAYAEQLADYIPHPEHLRRQQTILPVIELLLYERIGEGAKKMVNQLREVPVISTTDHHSLLQHPFWVNANLVAAAAYKNRSLPYIPVFSFASVSLNNNDGYARGLCWEENGRQQKYPLFPDRCKMHTVYGHRSFTLREYENLVRKLKKSEQGARVAAMLPELVGTSTVMEAPGLTAQITEANFHIWRTLFAGVVAAPDLVYMEIEQVVAAILQHILQTEHTSVLYKLMFDPMYHHAMQDLFNGIRGAFDTNLKSGTFLFWARGKEGKRQQLFLQNGKLTSPDGAVRYALDPGAIKIALEQKNIFPGAMLCYLVLALQYGFKCIGGFCQINDLTAMQAAWHKLLVSRGERGEAALISNVPTQALSDGIALLVKKTRDRISLASSWDIISSPKKIDFSVYCGVLGTITLGKALMPLLPDMYKVVYTATERTHELEAVREEDIIREMELMKEIPAELIF